jgi:hypothetical protein
MNRETLGSLAGMVADLLRRDNIGVSAQYWVNQALGEIYSTVSSPMTNRPAVFSITSPANGQAMWEVDTLPPNIISPRSLVMVLADGNNLTYAPTYLPPSDFFERSTWQATGVLGSPKNYTIESVGSPTPVALTGHETLRRMHIYFDPALLAGDWRCYFTYEAVPTWQDSADGYIECFPWWEPVVVWKAAAIGARALRIPTYEIFEAEAAHAIKVMTSVENYRPDAVPVPKDIQGSLGLGPRFAPQLPDVVQTS